MRQHVTRLWHGMPRNGCGHVVSSLMPLGAIMCYLRVRSVQASSFLMEVVSYNTLVAALARQRRWQSAFAAAMSAPVQDKCERQAHRHTHTHTERCAHFHSDTLNHRTHTFHRTPFPSHTRFRCVCVCPTLLPREKQGARNLRVSVLANEDQTPPRCKRTCMLGH